MDEKKRKALFKIFKKYKIKSVKIFDNPHTFFDKEKTIFLYIDFIKKQIDKEFLFFMKILMKK